MKIAFIGTGGIARSHAQGLAKRSDVTFVGACDVDLARSTAFALEYGGEAFTDPAEMLDRTKPDAAWVCLPPFAHGEAELSLLDRRIPFLVEKPISNDLATAHKILDGVERTGTLTSVGYMTRYRRGVQRVREILQGDPPVLAHGAWIGGAPGVYWWRVKALSGGQIVEQTTHIFDLARYLLGEVETVYAAGYQGLMTDVPDYSTEDASSVTLKFASGTVAVINSTDVLPTGAGKVGMDLMGRDFRLVHDNRTLTVYGKGERTTYDAQMDPYLLEDQTFVAAVASGDASALRSTYSDAVKTHLVTMAANRSLETGQVEKVAAY